MSTVHELAEARRQSRAAQDLMWSLNAKIVLAQRAISLPGPLEPDERKQLAYQARSLFVARDRALSDWLAWKRIVAKLSPAVRHRGSVDLTL